MMKQKELTTEQEQICKELKTMIDKAGRSGIKFVYDNADCLLSAYNGDGIESVNQDYSRSMRKNPVEFDWEKTFDIGYANDSVNTDGLDVYVDFVEE